jgi:acetolactate synthase-1/2/3 large subunit
MAIELAGMRVATERYGSTNLGGNYADLMRAFGGRAERVTHPAEIVPAIRRGLRSVEESHPTLLEFVTAQETRISSFAAPG